MCIALHDVGFHAQLPGQRKVSCPLLAHHLKYPGSQIFLSNASGFIARGMVDNDELEAFGNELGDQHLEKLRFIAVVLPVMALCWTRWWPYHCPAP